MMVGVFSMQQVVINGNMCCRITKGTLGFYFMIMVVVQKLWRIISGYYPFGAVHEEQSDYSQKYLFGGKELQTELDLGWSDFGPRCFNNWSGRWLGIDIMSEVTPQASPDGYTLGNPVRFSGPTGMLTEDENGLITTSTSLSGRDATGGGNSGRIGTEIRAEAASNSPDNELYRMMVMLRLQQGRVLCVDLIPVDKKGSHLQKSRWLMI